MSIAELTGIDVPTGLLIGGEWSSGSSTFPVLDPATEEPIAEVADGVVVGSALIDALRQSLDPDMKATQSSVRAVTDLVRGLAEGVRGARRLAAE